MEIENSEREIKRVTERGRERGEREREREREIGAIGIYF